MVAHANKQQQQLRRLKLTTHRVIVATFLFSISFFLFSPKIPRSPTHHQFADLRNLLGKKFHFLFNLMKKISFFLIWMVLVSGFFTGVPNTVNVITNFPFLVVGVLGLVLTLEGGFFTVRLVTFIITVIEFTVIRF
jgi:hypothetical protein